MYKTNDFYCVHPDWQLNYANDYGAELINNKIIEAPESLGEGHTFFSYVIPGIALLLMDFTVSSPIKIKRIEEDTYRYIFHYDLSEETNFLLVKNKKYKIGSAVNIGMTIFNNQVESYFEPAVGKRTFVLRLFVDQKLMLNFLDNIDLKNELKQKLSPSDKTLLFDSIDANSILLMLSIKEKSIFQESFNSFIRGIALQLLGTFLKKHSGSSKESTFNKSEIERLILVKEYLLNNLDEKFPSIAFLSKIAGMSTTKFKISFKKQFEVTPNKMFINEKMNVAFRMLQSGEYFTINEISNAIHFGNSKQFNNQYFNVHNRKPIEDLVKMTR